MKLFIIAFACFAALCSALEEPEEHVLLDPGFLTRTSWTHQIAFHEMQDEIDATFVEINKVVATALAGASSSALRKYSNLSDNVLIKYEPVFDQIRTDETENECWGLVTSLLQTTVAQTGISSGNCFSTFSRRVKGESDRAAAALKGFSGQYGQVVLNVYQSYVHMNAMVQSEIIENNINTTYAQIAADWTNLQPAIANLRTTLNTNINGFGTQLTTCFGSSYNFADSMIVIIQTQVDECIEWGNNRNTRGGRSKSVSAFKDYTAELEQLVAQHEDYAW